MIETVLTVSDHEQLTTFLVYAMQRTSEYDNFL